MFSFEAGINSGVQPLLLPKNQLAFGTNCTVRGAFLTDRPKYLRLTLNFNGDAQLEERVTQRNFQGACFYKSDTGLASIIAAIGGGLFQFSIVGNAATVRDVSIPGDPNPPSQPIAWLWQSENYVIVNDGQSLPIFFDGNTSRRSYGPSMVLGQVNGDVTMPAIGANATIVLDAPYTGPIGVNIYICDNVFTVVGQSPGASGYTAFLTNVDDTPGTLLPDNSQVIIPGNAGSSNVVGLSNTNITLGPYCGGCASDPEHGVVSDHGTLYINPRNQNPGSFFTAYVNGNRIGLNGGTSTPSGFQYIVSNPNAYSITIHVGDQITLSGSSTPPTPDVSLGATIGTTLIPVPNQSVLAHLTQLYSGAANQPVTINGKHWKISSAPQPPVTGNNLVVTNVNTDPALVPKILDNCLLTSIGELPAGRMGTYGMGRNWMSLIDGRQFIAGDIVGGSSGSPAFNFRDAVLKVKENSYLAGGGTFRIPVAGEEIRFMRFTATLDASLGQGALQVGTQNALFSCNTPVDRTTWTSLTNPILTYSLITNGGQAQNSAINVNGDILFRSLDGLRSLILARRDFATWGNVPISREMERVLSKDDESLLIYGSAIVFQNRYLVTARPFQHSLGVGHSTLVAINFDPLSSLRGKEPSVYDPPWTGLNTLQLLVGQVLDVERAFSLCLNTVAGKIELWEIQKDGAATKDNVNIPVIWSAESGALFNHVKGKTLMEPMRLVDGEIFIDDLIGRADIQVWYRPDSYPCWIPWHHFSICASTAPMSKPGYRTRLGLGEPDGRVCEKSNDRPFREFYWCQVRLVIQGHLRFLGARFKGVLIPQLDFARPECECPPMPPLQNPTIIMVEQPLIGGEGGEVIGGEGGGGFGGE